MNDMIVILLLLYIFINMFGIFSSIRNVPDKELFSEYLIEIFKPHKNMTLLGNIMMYLWLTPSKILHVIVAIVFIASLKIGEFARPFLYKE